MYHCYGHAVMVFYAYRLHDGGGNARGISQQPVKALYSFYCFISAMLIKHLPIAYHIICYYHSARP